MLRYAGGSFHGTIPIGRECTGCVSRESSTLILTTAGSSTKSFHNPFHSFFRLDEKRKVVVYFLHIFLSNISIIKSHIKKKKENLLENNEKIIFRDLRFVADY